MKNINIGIIGITGYTGIELIKTLNNHPLANIVFVGANTNYGSYINDHIPNLKLTKRLRIKKNIEILRNKNLDLIFSCLPNGGLVSIYNRLKKLDAKIIDLSGDFRLNQKSHNKWYESKK